MRRSSGPWLALSFVSATCWLLGCGSDGGGGASDGADAGSDNDGATPALHTVSVRVTSAIAVGERFEFAMNGMHAVVMQSSQAVAFTQGLAGGTAYTVSQTSGPRTCQLTPNRSGTIGSVDVVVDAQCGAPAAQAVLSGELRGPVGSKVTLRNAGESLPVTVTPATGSSDHYNIVPFTFATKTDAGSPYALTIESQASGLSCKVYNGASGTLPVAKDAVKVGCEYVFDHVSRSSDDAALGTYYDSTDVVVGGYSTAVGTTTTAFGEGRFVAFVSSAAGIGGSDGSYRQIFWRDRLTGETKLISANEAGTPGDGNSFAPAISSDGLHVVFESYAKNLVASDGNGVRDVFVWAAESGVIATGVTRVSVGAGGVEADSESYAPSISGDGGVVAFSTSASNLTAGVSGNSTVNVVRRDLKTGVNTLVSANSQGKGVGGDRASLSEDGNRLAFWSFASDLTANDTNGLWDVFVYQHDDGTRRRISLTATGGERNIGAESASRIVSPTLSGNGRFVAYATTASNVVANDDNGAQDVFLVDLDGNEGVRRVSVGANGAQGDADTPSGQGERVALSYDGTWVAFTSQATTFGALAGNVIMRNVSTGETRAITNITYGVAPPSLSRGAAYVVFGAADKLDPRFASTGLFAHFTGIASAWWWIE